MTLRDDSGQALIEVALSLMLLLVFSMAAMDFGYLFSQKLTLQNTSLGYLNTSNTGDVSMTCTNEGGGCPNSAGGPGDLVTISVSYPYTFLSPMLAAFFPSHSYTIKVGASFTNESFPPSAS
jgi:TadE-like protein